jgi:hypothetical protein
LFTMPLCFYTTNFFIYTCFFFTFYYIFITVYMCDIPGINPLTYQLMGMLFVHLHLHHSGNIIL